MKTRYLLAASNPLTRLNKQKIASIFGGLIQSPSDIFGAEDLNDILARHEEVVQRHYKLWLQSAVVIGALFNKAILDRSRAILEEIRDKSPRYVPTDAYQAAKRKLNTKRVVIITGEPGVGKTTLAEQLCLASVAEGFDLRVVGEEIREAEDAFLENASQVFYFDDFLGTNYLEALSGHEGTHIARFIARIRRAKNKRFILTSRSTILNQGKILIDRLHRENIERDEYEITIKSLKPLDRGRILYSHLWHSGLDKRHVEALYLDKRYREIVDHPNFNPRLISFITDASRANVVPPQDYWPWIKQSLDNPSEIWENPFTAQHDDYGRALVLLVALNGDTIAEHALSEAYERYIAVTPGLSGRRDLLYQLRHLAGSMLSRVLADKKRVMISLFNPSIGDFILHRYTRDIPSLLRAISCLRTSNSLQRLEDFRRHGVLKSGDVARTCRAIFDTAASVSFENFGAEYVARALLISTTRPLSDEATGRYQAFCEYVQATEVPSSHLRTARCFLEAYDADAIDSSTLMAFTQRAVKLDPAGGELLVLSECIARLERAGQLVQALAERLRERIVDEIGDSIDDEIDESEVFGAIGPEDIKDAKRALHNNVSAVLDRYAISFDDYEIEQIMNNYDLESKMRRYFEPDRYSDVERATQYVPPSADEIDDLFDRS